MYQGKKVIHIAARGLGGEIGVNNKLLDDVQYALDQAYQYAEEQFNNSCEDVRDV